MALQVQEIDLGLVFDEAKIKKIVEDVVKENPAMGETDPTVPDWAKQPNKPTYSYDEITGKPNLVEETWTFTLEDGSTVTKKVITG